MGRTSLLHTRRQFLRGGMGLAALGLLPACGMLPPQTQQPARVPRIGYLSVGPSEPSPLVDAFRQGLAEHGYVDGRSIAVEYRFGEERTERLSEYAAELVAGDPELAGHPGLRALVDAVVAEDRAEYLEKV